MRRPPPKSTLFPYTTLFRSLRGRRRRQEGLQRRGERAGSRQLRQLCRPSGRVRLDPGAKRLTELTDRKSTRLNSSHVEISYAVFCLKKKTGSLPTMLYTSSV